MKKETDRHLLRRLLASLALLVIAGLFVLLLWLAFTGADSGQLLAVLFMLIVIPALFYIFNWFAGVIRKK